MITAELIDRLVEATNEAKATVRECHEARRDLKLLLRELSERTAAIRGEVIKGNNDLAEREWRKAMESINLTELGAGLKRTFDEWMKLLDEANHILAVLDKKAKVSAL